MIIVADAPSALLAPLALLHSCTPGRVQGCQECIGCKGAHEAFVRFATLSVLLRVLVGAGKGETRKADVLCDLLERLVLRLTPLQKSVASGLLADLMQPAAWEPPPLPKGKQKRETVAGWEEKVADAVGEGPEALLDALRRPPPAPHQQRRRQEMRAAAWRQIGSEAAAAAFLARV